MRSRLVALLLLVLAAGMACDEAKEVAPAGRASATPSPSPRPPRATAPVHPHTDAVLSIYPDAVESGQVVSVRFAPPPEYIWGADAELLRIEDGKAKRVAWLSTWAGKKKIVTVWPQPNLGFPSIGFYGKETWAWQVPKRLGPGTYAIEKDAIEDGVEDGVEPIEDRLNEWRVRFKVM